MLNDHNTGGKIGTTALDTYLLYVQTSIENRHHITLQAITNRALLRYAELLCHFFYWPVCACTAGPNLTILFANYTLDSVARLRI